MVGEAQDGIVGPGYNSNGYILGCSHVSLRASSAQLGLGIDVQIIWDSKLVD